MSEFFQTVAQVLGIGILVIIGLFIAAAANPSVRSIPSSLSAKRPLNSSGLFHTHVKA